MKKMMYYLCMMMFIVVVPMSCKDDNEKPAKELLLSKIVRDEEPLMDFVYDEKKISRANLYDGDGDLMLYTMYEYEYDDVVESRLFSATSIMQSQITFTHNEAGQITKGEIYTKDSDFEELERTVFFSYYESGQLKTMSIAALGQPIYLLDEFTYDDKGHRVQLTRLSNPDESDEYVSYQVDYTPGKKVIPNHWNDYEILLMTFDVDGYIWDMFNVSTHRTSWDSDGDVKTETQTDASNQQFNGDGYLISQTLERKSLVGLSPKQLDDMTYEYVE